MGIGSMELVLILIIALIVFGPQRLVEIARWLGKTIREIRKIGTELTKPIKEMDTELTKPIKEMGTELTKSINQENVKKAGLTKSITPSDAKKRG